MKKRTCISLDLAYLVKMEQTGFDRFTVTYGLQVRSGLTYAQAAENFGQCVMHALTLSGKIETR